MRNKAFIILAFVFIGLTMWGVWHFAYKPNFSTAFSASNADWGNFGDFFWGLGVMCFSALNVYVFWQIEQQMRRDSLVRDLRTMVEKIREAHSVNGYDIIASRIESFKYAVGAALKSGLLSYKSKKCVERFLIHLRSEEIDYETAPYFCEAIIYAISVNKNIDNSSKKSKADTFGELGLMEKLKLWDKKVKEETNEREEQTAIEGGKISFDGYLRNEIFTAKRLSRLFPQAKIYPQFEIPNTNLVMDALMVEKGKNDTIVEFKSNFNPESVKKAIRQLDNYEKAYKQAYSKNANLAILFEERIDGKKLPPNILEELRNHKISILQFPMDFK